MHFCTDGRPLSSFNGVECVQGNLTFFMPFKDKDNDNHKDNAMSLMTITTKLDIFKS